MNAKKLGWLAFFLLVSSAAGAIGSVFTFQAIPTWYAELQKPPFNPPNWIFGPVWTTLYLCMGIAAYLVHEKAGKKARGKSALSFFYIQLVLNTLWSILFFGLHMPFVAFLEILVLWLFILLTLIKFYTLSRPAGLLFVPYLLWVTFASILNLFIALLN